MTETTYGYKDDHTADQCRFETCERCGCCAHGKQHVIGCSTEDAPVGFACPNDDCGCTGQGKGMPRMVPADEPEAWPFAPGDVVRDHGEDGDDAAWLDAAPQYTLLVDSQGTEWIRLGNGWFPPDTHERIGRWASLNLNETYGPLSVVRVGQDATHPARPATPSARATPAVGAGSSEGAEGSQIGVHASGLGARIRDVLARTGVPSEVALREWAERADALERSNADLRSRLGLCFRTLTEERGDFARLELAVDAASQRGDQWHADAVKAEAQLAQVRAFIDAGANRHDVAYDAIRDFLQDAQ